MFIDLSSSEMRTPARKRRMALIVEDDPRLRKTLSGQFASMDFHVLSASHFDAAVAHLAMCIPHVICIDIGLPAKSGYELCEHIRGPLGLSRIPIIVTSEYRHAWDLAQAENVGANAFLRKPFSLSQVTSCVDALFNRTPWTRSFTGELERLSVGPASRRTSPGGSAPTGAPASSGLSAKGSTSVYRSVA
jgi:DNA-binding response OmpR family regulator